MDQPFWLNILRVTSQEVRKDRRDRDRDADLGTVLAFEVGVDLLASNFGSRSDRIAVTAVGTRDGLNWGILAREVWES